MQMETILETAPTSISKIQYRVCVTVTASERCCIERKHNGCKQQEGEQLQQHLPEQQQPECVEEQPPASPHASHKQQGNGSACHPDNLMQHNKQPDEQPANSRQQRGGT
jgi:hypothetical protein